jgi:hypothetical protein
MRLMKVFGKMKSRTNSECQDCFQWILIEALKMKMLMIQFVSILNLIQMWLMKMIHNMKNSSNKRISTFLDLMIHWKWKYLWFQFVSSLNLIEMKLIKAIYNLIKIRGMNQQNATKLYDPCFCLVKFSPQKVEFLKNENGGSNAARYTTVLLNKPSHLFWESDHPLMLSIGDDSLSLDSPIVTP